MEIKPPFVDLPRLIGGREPESVGGEKNEPEALRRTCRQFEAIFIQELFKGMRATVPAGGLQENTGGIQIFQDFMDQQVAEDMAKKQGLGIAEALFRQLNQKSGSGL